VETLIPEHLVVSATFQSCVVKLPISAQKLITILFAICNKILLPSTVGVTQESLGRYVMVVE
jgi:hypothetical protein